jgi:hypothetical protein
MRRPIFLLFQCFFLTFTAGAPFAFMLPDTGQTKCYQAVSPYAEVTCAGTGQDGEYDINPMSYSVNGDGTVTDINTGLMWQAQDDDHQWNWYWATGTYNDTYNRDNHDICGELNTGDYSDWRTPTKHELATLVDYSIPPPGPRIKPGYFSGTESDKYWTGSSISFLADPPGSAWRVDFYSGAVDATTRGTLQYVRCVRGGYTGSALVDNHDGTVTDTTTGLRWQQGEPEKKSWGAALTHCRTLTLGEATNWRLPNIKELETLTTGFNPSINKAFFPSASSANYWSSTTYSSNLRSSAWVIDFMYGWSSGRGKTAVESFRCVQGGQDEPAANLNISFSGTGSGTVSGSGVRNGSPVEFSTDLATTEQFDLETTVTIHGAPAEYSLFTGWGGDCSGTAECGLSMTVDRDVTALFSFDTAHKSRVGASYYSTLQGACDAADPGETIKAWSTVYAESLNCALSDNVTLRGGFNGAYTSNTGMTTIHGHLTVHSYALTLENIVIR